MKAKYLMAVMLTLSIFSMAARRAVIADELVGNWNYTVSNVPPEYETGTMTFEKKDDKLIGFMGPDKAQMQNLIIDQGKVSFKLDFQGGTISFNLKQDGDKLSGAISSNDGEFPISAVRNVQK